MDASSKHIDAVQSPVSTFISRKARETPTQRRSPIKSTNLGSSEPVNEAVRVELMAPGATTADGLFCPPYDAVIIDILAFCETVAAAITEAGTQS